LGGFWFVPLDRRRAHIATNWLSNSQQIAILIMYLTSFRGPYEQTPIRERETLDRFLANVSTVSNQPIFEN
jgi:hypothetical protein